MINNNSSNYRSLKKRDLYKGVSFIGSLGVWYTIIGLIGAIIFLVVFLVIVNFVYHYKWVVIQAEVVENPKCYSHIEIHDNVEHTTIKCDYLVKYTVNNQEYRGKLLQKDNINLIHIDDKQYLNIEYNPNNPNEIDTIFPKHIINIILGSILIVFVILTIIILIYRDNNVVKALSTLNMARDIIKR